MFYGLFVVVFVHASNIEPELLPYGCVVWSHDASTTQDESVWRTAALIMTSFVFMKQSSEKR